MISIIIPVYNVQEYLNECIDSVINQTYKNLQIILVDDGSTDNSGKICDEYAEKDKRVIVLHKQNGGLSEARNYGLDIAIGQYIFFLDSDDYIHSQMCEILYYFAIKEKADIVTCCYERDDEKLLKIPIVVENVDKIKLNGKEDFDEILGYANVISCCKLFNKNILTGYNFKIGKFHEDEYIHRILYKSNCVVCLKEKLYFYRRNPNSITNVFNVKRIYDAFEAYEDRITFAKTHGWNKILLSSINRYCEYAINQYNIIKKNNLYKKYPEITNLCRTNIKKQLLINNNIKIEKKYYYFAKNILFYRIYTFLFSLRQKLINLFIKIKKLFTFIFLWEENSNKWLRKKIDILIRIGIIPRIKNKKEDIVISLTTYGDRYNEIQYTLYSIFRQNYKPNKIVLWLDENEFSFDEIKQNKALSKFIKKGLLVNFCKNYGSYKKIIPALNYYPKSKIIICDDDAYYNKKWLKLLISEEKKFPNDILCHRGNYIQVKDRHLESYLHWYSCNEAKESYFILPTGVGGTLVKKTFFYKDFFDSSLFMRLAPNADDLWIWSQAVLKGTKIRLINGFISNIKDFGNDKDWPKLYLLNAQKNGNDIKMNNLISYYPKLKNILDIE